MKLIFLDIDGVLVTRRLATFEEPLLRNLKRVVDQTGAEIVLSSDWRRHPAARAEAARVLATVGLNFISCTPCLSIYIAQRPTEIVQWQRDFGRRADPSQKNYTLGGDRRPGVARGTARVVSERPLCANAANEGTHGGQMRGSRANPQPRGQAVRWHHHPVRADGAW
eukprot:TRINITY_DN3961_c0_g1_i1.p2 TRINITY_DN3961_c0_g1~~TRINITY_DN3961_c0_g1_i1.p2  ORF type:complete len:167 (+),score=16.16 TRINITY_DN3961_c0_g1_i1:63-563(+)